MRFKPIFYLFIFTSIILATSTLASAQQAAETKKEDTTATRTFKSKIFEIKHRDPGMLASVLADLGSGSGNARITPNQELRTITVRDFPENIAVIEEALKRLDVPAPAPVSMEVQLHVIVASQDSEEKGPFPAQLEPIKNQLQAALKYGNYRYITTLLNRVNEGGSINSRGATNSIFPAPQDAKSFYNYDLERVRLGSDPSGKEAVQISKFRFNMSIPLSTSGGGFQYQDIGITTPLSLREGETVVVGTTNAGRSSDAVVVAISIKKVK